jgi:peptidyl-prolyl cis-trans isomerase C
MLGLFAASLVLADCNGAPPKGQVLAVVNGQEVTGQDLAAEARATAGKGSQTRQAVLQRVIARVLLAQAAHADKLDRYPGYPSDVARLQQDFVAQKMVKAVVKAPANPAPAQETSFIDAHPNIFKDRMRLQADEIRFQSLDDMKSLDGAQTIPAVASRLQSLNVPFNRESRTIDTAELPPALAEKLLALPPGQIFYLREQDVVLGVMIQSRQPVSMSADQQAALAKQLMAQASIQGQVDAEVKRLQAQAKITYQSGYAPPPPPHSAQPASPDAKAAPAQD